MSREKLILAIDYNNIAHRSMYTSRYGADFVTSFDTDKECAVFARGLIKDIVNLSKLFNPSEVYLLSDSKDPWRKKMFPDYKGTRKKDDTINFDNIYKTMGEVADELKHYGYCRLMVDHAEADDLAAMLKRIMKAEGSSILYVSSDADWRQLIEFDETTKRFIAVYNPFVSGTRGIRNLFVPKGFEEWMGARENFGSKNSSAKFSIEHAIQFEKTMRLVETDPDDILLTKILCGDDSDNVPSFHEFLSGKGKRIRLTERKKDKLLECCSAPTNVAELKSRIDDGSLCRSFKEALKWNLEEVDLSLVLDRQRKYVDLDPSLFPDYVRSGFVETIRNLDRSKLAFHSFEVNPNRIIENSKFKYTKDVKNGARVSNIFNTLGVITNIRKPSDL